MTPKKRSAPTSLRLPQDLRLKAIKVADALGIPLNALIVRALVAYLKAQQPKEAPNQSQQEMTAALGDLGASATGIRQLVKSGLLDIFPGLEDLVHQTLVKLCKTCNRIMSAHERPGDST